MDARNYPSSQALGATFSPSTQTDTGWECTQRHWSLPTDSLQAYVLYVPHAVSHSMKASSCYGTTSGTDNVDRTATAALNQPDI